MIEVKIKARPNQMIRFPALCVHCAQPGGEPLQIRRQMGRATRLVEVPLCAVCGEQLRRRSGEEERWQKIGWILTAVFPLILLLITLLLTPTALPFWLRLLISLFVANLGGWAAWSFSQRKQRQAALPEKKAVLHAARINAFSWRATTFAFTNATFAEQFRSLNESLLMTM